MQRVQSLTRNGLRKNPSPSPFILQSNKISNRNLKKSFCFQQKILLKISKITSNLDKAPKIAQNHAIDSESSLKRPVQINSNFVFSPILSLSNTFQFKFSQNFPPRVPPYNVEPTSPRFDYFRPYRSKMFSQLHDIFQLFIVSSSSTRKLFN